MRAWHVVSGDWSLPGLDPRVVYLLPVDALFEMVKDRQPVDLPLDEVCYREDVVSEERLHACSLDYPCIVAEGVANPDRRPYRLLDGNHRLHKMRREHRRSARFYVLKHDDFRHLVKRFEEYLPDWPVQPNLDGLEPIGPGEVTRLLAQAGEGTAAYAAEMMALARRLVANRRFAQAIEILDRVLAADPAARQALRLRARILRLVARHEEAVADLGRLLAGEADDAELWRQRADSLRTLGRTGAAEADFLETLRLDPANVAAMADLGTMYRDAGRHGEAVEWLTRAAGHAPADGGLNTLLGAALVAAGRIEDGVAVLERAFHINPYDRLTLAYLYIAYVRAGRPHDAAALARADDLVRSFQRPGSGTGGGPTDDLDRRLAEHVRRHPTLEHERPGNTTRGGAHTGNLLENEPGPVADLVRWIEQSVHDYLSALPTERSHPYLAWTPDAWDLDAWGVVIRPGGYQQAHIHQDGWISGVYYVEVPGAVVAGDDDGPEGCLEIGCPPDAFVGDTPFPTRILRPRPGRMHLFPSFHWHRTFPYADGGDRICIAFDVRPRV